MVTFCSCKKTNKLRFRICKKQEHFIWAYLLSLEGNIILAVFGWQMNIFCICRGWFIIDLVAAIPFDLLLFGSDTDEVSFRRIFSLMNFWSRNIFPNNKMFLFPVTQCSSNPLNFYLMFLTVHHMGRPCSSLCRPNNHKFKY